MNKYYMKTIKTISNWIKEMKIPDSAKVYVNGLLMQKTEYNKNIFNFKNRDAIFCEWGKNLINFKWAYNKVYADFFKMANK